MERIRLILSDVDGVLTDGGLIYGYRFGAESELKRFHVRDGMGIRLWQEAGRQFGLITARDSSIVARRAKELKIDLVRQGVGDKLSAAESIVANLGLGWDEVCYIGDDFPDLSMIQRAGFGVTVADAPQAIREAADWVTSIPGGSGAVRELIEKLLVAQGLWSGVLKRYSS
ncbi:MAG TPA: HAD hydrolase family protein [Pirellulaceae bacterium]|nr:HAD hydrolase family protein [Pirellulaceae bacterium]